MEYEIEKTFKFSRNYEQCVADAARRVKSILEQKGIVPEWGIVLGSGLNDLAQLIENATTIPYSEIPGFPIPTVAGHEGNLIIGTLKGVPIIGLQGRKHYYEVADSPFNTGMLQVVFLVHVLADLGVKNYFVTNAAGGLNMSYAIGDMMILDSHINMMGINPLVGRQKEFARVDGNAMRRFDPMNDAYDEKYINMLKDSQHHVGTYLAVVGPNYETSAECLAFRNMGADAVGMSTIPEVLAAKSRGMRVVGFSCITNKIAQDGTNATNHEEVKAILDSTAVREKIMLSVSDFFAKYKEYSVKHD